MTAGARHDLSHFREVSLTVKTRMPRHSVVAPILAAPLLTDTRRLTVGPGTREDHDAVPALAVTAAPASVVKYIAMFAVTAAIAPVVEYTAPAPVVIAARTQLGKKPRLSSAPAVRLRQAARFCRATRGHSSASCDAECLGCPASLGVNRGRAGTRVSPSVLR